SHETLYGMAALHETCFPCHIPARNHDHALRTLVPRSATERMEQMATPESTGSIVLSRRTLLRNGAAVAALAAFSTIAHGNEATQENTMAQTSTDKNMIRPFPHLNVPEAELSDLR